MKRSLILLAYRLCLDWIYGNWICVYYGYYGFDGRLSLVGYVESFVFLLAGTCLMKLNDKASSIILHYIYIMYFVPFTTMVAFDAFDDCLYKYLYMIYWVILVSLYSLMNSRTYKIKSSVLDICKFSAKSKKIIFWTILCILIFNVIYVCVVYRGFNFTLNVYDIYLARDKIREIDIPTVSSYLLSATKLCIPILMFTFYNMRKYHYVAAMIIVCMLSYAALALKAILFIGIIAIVIVILKIKYSHIRILFYSLSFCLFSILEYVIFKTGYIIELVIRRIFFLTNLLSYQYFDYFTIHGPDYFRSSFLRWFGFKSEYLDERIVKVIGRVYYGMDMPANNGLLADVFANLGIIGIFIMPIIIVITLYMFDKSTKDLPQSMLMLPCLIIASLFIDTFLTVALLTHGAILSMILLYTIPRMSLIK